MFNLASSTSNIFKYLVYIISYAYNLSSPLLNAGKAAPANVEPFPSVVHRSDVSQQDKERWNSIGYTEIASGRVAVLILAGGQVRNGDISSIKSDY
jgi:UDP-N-acetylglucosamine pyrophosphorylase